MKVKIKPGNLEEKAEDEPYCKHCSANLAQGASICHVCEKFIFPLRVTVVLTKEEDNWVINHMHFSNPIGLFNSFPRK